LHWYGQLGTGQVPLQQLQPTYIAAQPMVGGQQMVAAMPMVAAQPMVAGQPMVAYAGQPMVAIPVSSQ